MKDNSLLKIPNKKYFTISEASKLCVVKQHTLRFWEKEFDILKPKKNKKGNRMFTKKDMRNLDIIYHLVKERGFTLEGAKKKLKENKSDTIDNITIINKLKELKSFLVEMRNEL